MASPGRNVVSCKSLQGQAAETTKKHTQPNPLRLSLLDYSRYIISGQSKPIDVKSLISNSLRRKRARFSRNMDGTQPHYSQFARAENRKLVLSAANASKLEWQVGGPISAVVGEKPKKC